MSTVIIGIGVVLGFFGICTTGVVIMCMLAPKWVDEACGKETDEHTSDEEAEIH